MREKVTSMARFSLFPGQVSMAKLLISSRVFFFTWKINYVSFVTLRDLLRTWSIIVIIVICKDIILSRRRKIMEKIIIFRLLYFVYPRFSIHVHLTERRNYNISNIWIDRTSHSTRICRVAETQKGGHLLRMEYNFLSCYIIIKVPTFRIIFSRIDPARHYRCVALSL